MRPDDVPGYNVRAVAAALAFALRPIDGVPWTFQQPRTLDDAEERDDDRVSLVCGDARLFLHRPWRNDKRLTIDGSFPRGYEQRGFEINVDPRREIKVIARDVERRILEPYLAKLAEVLATKAKNEANKVAARETVRRVAAALRARDPTIRTDQYDHHNPGRPDESRTSESWQIYPRNDVIYAVTVDSYYPDRVKFKEITTTTERALAVIATLARSSTTAKRRK